MANSAELNIFLRLQDQLSAGLDVVKGKVKGFQEQTRSLSQDLKTLGRETSQVGSSLAMLGAAITGPYVLAFKTASQSSDEAYNSLRSLSLNMRELQNIVGNAIAPTVSRFAAVISDLVDKFNALDPQMRDTILRGVFMTGVVMLLGGAFIKLIGTIEKLSAFFLKFNVAILAIAGIVIVTNLLIDNWEKVRDTVLPVIDKFELGILKISRAFNQLAISKAQQSFFGLGKNLPGVRDFISALQTNIATLDRAIADIQNKVAAGGHGAAGSGLDAVLTNLKRFKDEFAGIMSGQGGGRNSSDDMKQFFSDFNMGLTEAMRKSAEFGAQLSTIFVNSIHQLSQGFGNAVAEMIVHGKNFGESMKAVGEQMAVSFITSVVSMVSEWLIFQAIQQAFMPLMVSLGMSAATTLASIWSPVAAMVSLATMGGNAAPAMASIGAATAFAYAAGMPKLAEGGNIMSAGSVMVGERGPEILRLPRGASVAPLDKSSAGAANFNFIGPSYFNTEENAEDTLRRISRLIDEKRRSRV